MKYLYQIIFLSILFAEIVLSSGLIIPTNENYPKELLRNKSTEITVNIKGNIAKTIVYEEFINEGLEETDGVYSFPLPMDARCLAIYYWRKDTLYQAVLKVQPQATNPGTGSGGIAAEVNNYIGKNGLRIKLLEIKPGGIQKVELHYISLLNYYNGKYSYTYPLNTSKFLNYQIDYLDINVNIESTQSIINFGSDSHPDLNIISSSNNSVKINYNKSKAYLASDFEFNYSIENNDFSMQFLSTKNISTGGHFAMFYNTKNISSAVETIDNRIVFLLENSSNMFGAKLDQSIQAIKEGLWSLNRNDKFNIILFNSSESNWKDELQIADSSNINAAIQFLDNINTGGGSNLDIGLEKALTQFENTTANNSIIIFTTGFSSVNISYINNLNIYETGIHCVGAGSNVNRARLEMLSNYNYGMTHYFTEANYNRRKLINFIDKITHPIVRNVQLSFEKGDIYEHITNNASVLFAGSNYYSSGKYSESENTFFAILGEESNSQFVKIFQVDFTADSVSNSYADKIWAKSKIDRLEWEIELNGETPSLKDSLIALSLAYGIRCKYTSYIANYEDDAIFLEDRDGDIIFPNDFSILTNNYPNPFNPTTTFRFFISTNDEGKVKFLKIFNILGQLIYMIDITNYSLGWHEIVFNGKDYFGKTLASGTYITSLQIDNKIVNSIKIIMVK